MVNYVIKIKNLKVMTKLENLKLMKKIKIGSKNIKNI